MPDANWRLMLKCPHCGREFPQGRVAVNGGTIPFHYYLTVHQDCPGTNQPPRELGDTRPLGKDQ